MRVPNRSLFRSADASDRSHPAAGDHPAPGEVLTEIGVLLATHLALAIAVAVTLRACGIA
jgi:hypothetical protein